MPTFRKITLFTLFGVLQICSAQLQQLGFIPIASKGSTALDRVIMISANPNLLHIYDPSTTNDTTISLPKAPLSLGVSADGLRAAAGHDGSITLIDLKAASIVKTVTVTGQAYNLALGDTFAMFTSGIYGGAAGVNIQSGAAISSNSFFLGTDGIFNADQTAFYLADDGSSPNDMQKTLIAGGQFTYSGSWPYHGDYKDCGPYYLAADGSRIYTSCGTVVHASTDKTLDMYYLETLPAASIPFAALAESASLKWWR